METVYQSNISILHKSLDLLISSILNNNNQGLCVSDGKLALIEPSPDGA